MAMPINIKNLINCRVIESNRVKSYLAGTPLQ